MPCASSSWLAALTRYPVWPFRPLSGFGFCGIGNFCSARLAGSIHFFSTMLFRVYAQRSLTSFLPSAVADDQSYWLGAWSREARYAPWLTFRFLASIP